MFLCYKKLKKNNFQSFHIICLIFILFFALIIRLYRLKYPTEYYFDEQYHIPAAKLIMRHDLRAFEWWHGSLETPYVHDWLHPPLAKYFQVISMNLLGVNSFAWRLPSVIFGVMTIGLVYYLGVQVFNKNVGLLAAFLLSMEGLFFVQSRIAMNDVFVSFWIMIAIVFYYRYIKSNNRFVFCLVCLFLGLAIATKWSAVFLLVGFSIIEFILFIKKRLTIRTLLFDIFLLIFMSFGFYLVSFFPLIKAKGLSHFMQLHHQIIWYQTHRDNRHAYASVPYQWFFNIRPVWYYKGVLNDESKVSNIYALGNPLIFLLSNIMVIHTIIIYVPLLIQKRKLNLESKKLFFLFGLYIILWLPWFFSPRIMFFYHYTVAVPLLMIIIGFWINKLFIKPKKYYSTASLLLAIVIMFMVYYPHWTGLPISKKFAQNLYFLLPSWK